MTKPLKRLSLAGGFAAIAFSIASATAMTAGVSATGMAVAALSATGAQAQSTRRIRGPVRTRPSCTSMLRCYTVQPHGFRRCRRVKICMR